MGSWNVTSFGNDAAIDWLAELVESRDASMLDEAFSAVLGAGDDPVEEQAGQEAIAACEVLAWLLGQPGETEEDTHALEKWVDDLEFEPSERLVSKAKRTIDRVYNAPSELREAYDESDDFEDWRHELSDLKERLVRGSS